MFVALEGIDGSGKSTIAKRLAAAIRETGTDVVLTREPGGTLIGEQIRDVLLSAASGEMAPESEVLLFAASRAQLVSEVIRPALDRGAVVLSDRFSDSTLAYQWGGRRLDRDAVAAAQSLATGGLAPDLKVLFDLPVEQALGRRLAVREQTNRLDMETVQFHQRVRNAYLALVAEERARWIVVDATRGPNAVWADVVTSLNGSRLLSEHVDVEAGRCDAGEAP